MIGPLNLAGIELAIQVVAYEIERDDQQQQPVEGPRVLS